MERLRHRTVVLEAEQRLTKEKEYVSIQKQIADLRHRLWQVRLNIKRKSYSIRVRKKAMTELEASLVTFQGEERQQRTRLQQLEKQLKEVSQNYMRKAGVAT